MYRFSTKQVSESFELGIILALVGGYLDAYTYISRGHIFANAQTGNIVLLGIDLANGRFMDALTYFIPIMAFAGGILVVEMIQSRLKQYEKLHWRQITVAVEFFILLAASFVPRGKWDMAVNVAISFVCAMQVEAFRKLGGDTFATTMCTGNLRSATEQLYRHLQTKDPLVKKRSLRYYGIILFFILGAVLGTLITRVFGEKSVLFCCLLLFFVFLIMFIEPLEETGPEKGSCPTDQP